MNFKQSPMYTVGGIKPLGFILHGTTGNYEGTVSWLTTNRTENPSSAHYIIGKKHGDIIQIVNITDTAWHAGSISNPTPRAQAILPKNALGMFKNPNASFIGIEFEYMVGDKLTEWQYSQAIEIIKNSGIKNPQIMCHKEITRYKSDFTHLDGSIDNTIVNEILSRLNGIITDTTSVAPAIPVVAPPPAVSATKKAALQQKLAEVIKATGELSNLIETI